MQTLLAVLSAALALVAAAQTRTVQLYARDSATIYFDAATNEVVLVRDIVLSGNHQRVPTLNAWPDGDNVTLNFAKGESFMGKARWHFSQYPHDSTARAWAILDVSTVNATGTHPATVAVAPAGSEPVKVALEMSGNLFEWSPLVVTNLPASGTNRFFRVTLR